MGKDRLRMSVPSPNKFPPKHDSGPPDSVKNHFLGSIFSLNLLSFKFFSWTSSDYVPQVLHMFGLGFCHRDVPIAIGDNPSLLLGRHVQRLCRGNRVDGNIS